MADQPSGETDRPDVRSVLANERTLLAYQRTAIGLIVAALAFAHLLDGSAIIEVLAAVLLLAGAIAAIGGWIRYRQVDKDMRAGREASSSAMATLLTLAVLICLCLGGVALVVGTH